MDPKKVWIQEIWAQKFFYPKSFRSQKILEYKMLIRNNSWSKNFVKTKENCHNCSDKYLVSNL